jgi:hypothetical protein
MQRLQNIGGLAILGIVKRGHEHNLISDVTIEIESTITALVNLLLCQGQVDDLAWFALRVLGFCQTVAFFVDHEILSCQRDNGSSIICKSCRPINMIISDIESLGSVQPDKIRDSEAASKTGFRIWLGPSGLRFFFSMLDRFAIKVP